MRRSGWYAIITFWVLFAAAVLGQTMSKIVGVVALIGLAVLTIYWVSNQPAFGSSARTLITVALVGLADAMGLPDPFVAALFAAGLLHLVYAGSIHQSDRTSPPMRATFLGVRLPPRIAYSG